MNKLTCFGLVMGLGLIANSALAQDATQDPQPPKFMRSSIYTVLLRSSEQDKHFDEECEKESSGASLIKSFTNTDEKRQQNETENGPLSAMPQKAFLEIAIPDQFNDFNQEVRIIDFESVLPNLTDADKKIATQKKKSGGALGSMLAGVAKASVGLSAEGNTSNDKVNEFAQSVINHFAVENAVAPNFLAKWYDYGKTPDNWDTDYLIEMGLYDASEQEKAQAKATGLNGIYETRGLELINNSYLIGVNLRFRSNAAIVAEGEKVAGALLGSSSAQLLSAAASAAAGEGFSVEAVTYLFRLVWNSDLELQFYNDIQAKKASIDDLIASGICRLEYLGQEKAKARVRMSITNTKPMSELVKQATERAIDAAIAKLQVKYDVFRTSFPIVEVDGDGNVYANVGMKEGISKGDEYEIVEFEQDEKTKKGTWKKLGTVKAVDKKIWDNRAGAADSVGDGNDSEASDASAVNLGKTMFAGAKKGQDYSGYFLRLKKKK